MKKIVAAILFLGFIVESNAQQIPLYSNFVYNYLQYNPAVVGTAPCLDLKFGFRKQWTGIPSSPQTIFANVHGKLGGKKELSNFHGIGAAIENDQAGPFAYSTLHALYAYHMRLSRKYTLSAGAGIGFSQYRIDYSWMVMEDQLNDPTITGAINDFIFPMVNFGLWLYRYDKFYGLSIRNIAGRAVDGVDGGGKLKPHWTFANGYATKMADDFMFKPAFLINYVPQSKLSIEGQAMIEYRDVVGLGVSARTGHGVSALFRITVLQYVSLAYAFDLTANKLRYDGKNSHEVILGIRACKSADPRLVPCAAYD